MNSDVKDNRIEWKSEAELKKGVENWKWLETGRVACGEGAHTRMPDGFRERRSIGGPRVWMGTVMQLEGEMIWQLLTWGNWEDAEC